MTEAETEQARGAIRHILSVYNTGGDRGRIDEVLTAFAPDAVLEIPGAAHAGHAGIHAFLSDMATRGSSDLDLRGARHHLTTSRIELDGADAARGWTYFVVARHGTAIEEGTYIVRFRRTADGWKIVHRRVKILWSAGQ